MVSKLVEFFKNDEYTHASIALDKELNYMYSFGRKYAYNPFIGRFKQEDINKGLYKFHKTLPGIIVEIEVSKQQYEKAKTLIDHFIINTNLYKYNYKGLIHGLFNKEICYDNRFLCSEFVYHILKESSIMDLNVSRNLVRPQNFINLDSKIVYRGNLKAVKHQNNNYDSNGIIIRPLNVIYEQM